MSKIDNILDRLNSIDTTLAAQHESLKDHMRRTELLENEVKPLQKHVSMVEGALKFLGVLSVLGLILESILHLIGK